MKKFLPVLICTILGIILVYSAQMVMKSVTRSVYSIMVEARNHISMVVWFYDDPEIIMEELGEKGNIEKIMPLCHYAVTVRTTVGGYLESDILGVKGQDLDFLMKKLNMKIVKGRAPKEGQSEILMHVHCAAKNNLKVGDQLVTRDRWEWLPGPLKVVGLIDGEAMMSFIPIIDNKLNGLVFIPKKGRLKEMNAQISSYFIDCRQMTYETGMASFNATIESANTVITVTGIIVTVIVSIFVGLLCHVFFSQRKSEYGVFLAIGYPRQQILNKLFIEILAINCVALLIGMVLSMLVGYGLNITVSLPRGEPISLFDVKFLLSALCVPVYSIIFSIVPIWRMLKNLEPISIIEGI